MASGGAVTATPSADGKERRLGLVGLEGLEVGGEVRKFSRSTFSWLRVRAFFFFWGGILGMVGGW